MLYFAYGSNLNHYQMKKRCKDSKFLKNFDLEGFKLTFRSIYRAADIEIKKDSIVTGALFEISKNDEKKLDLYEDFPTLYKKLYFKYNMVRKSPFMYPKELYLNTIKQGYKDCELDTNYLKMALKN